MAWKEVEVGRLSQGQLFRLHLDFPEDPPRYGHLDYKLLYVNECRAYVEPANRETRQIRSASGEVLAEFEDARGRTNISPGTMVEPLGSTNSKTGAFKPMAKKPDIHHPPQAPKRPLRQGTTRAKMLAMLLDDLAGETKISDVMTAFDMPRSLVLAHVWEMWNCHGYGYSVTDDSIIIAQPLEDDAEDLL